MSNLSRVLEPELIESQEEAFDYDAMDHLEANQKFVNDLLAAERVAGEVLDLGTGPAAIPIEMCERTTRVQILAVDLSVAMLDLARGNIEVAEWTDRIKLDRIDAKQLPYEEGRFACVMSNSLVHHSPTPSILLKEAVRVTAPGGFLFFRDLVRPDDDAAVRRLMDKYAIDDNRHQRRMYENSLRAALTLEEIQAEVAALGFSPETVRITSDRHWTWSAKKPG
jgi:ubiquinone/menaquinone biosynthesis C-methylase UbiE